MVSEVTPTAPAIGACLQCNQLFLVTDTRTSCLYCGKAPMVTLPFPVGITIDDTAGELGFTPAGEPAEPILIGVTCPHCHAKVQLAITDTEISVVAPPVAAPADEPAPVDRPATEAGPPPGTEPSPPAEEPPV